MQNIVLSVFVAMCMIGVFRPSTAFALVVFIFPIKQFIQLYVPWTLNPGLQGQFVNFAIGACVGLSLMGVLMRGRLIRAQSGLVASLVTVLYVFSATSIIWSPSVVRSDALGFVSVGWTYVALMVIGAPLLVTRVVDAVTCMRDSFIIGSIVCASIMLSPDFQTFAGTLSFNVGGSRSNYLSIGEVGGVTFIIGLLVRFGRLSWVGNALRLAGVALGVAVAFRSGARGQLVFALAIGLVCFPLSRQLKNFRNFLSASLAGALVVALVAVLVNTLTVDNLTERRWSIESMLYGSSSAEWRAATVTQFLSDWLQSPANWPLGFGLLSFRAMSEIQGGIYSHNVIVDMICELGIVGIVLFASIYWISVRQGINSMRRAASDPQARAAVACCCALGLYQFALASKQGMLWLSTAMFMYCVLLDRLASIPFSDDSELLEAVE